MDIREQIAKQKVTMPSTLPEQFVGTDLANRILAIKVEEDRVCKQCNGNGGYHGSFNSNSWKTCYECGGLKIFPGRTLKQVLEAQNG